MKSLPTASALLALAFLAAPAIAGDTPACVRWWPETVHMGIGYNHVVGIENNCERPVACVVTTDVAPDPIRATVPSKQKVELTTFRGSAASSFKAKVTCVLE